MCVRRLLPSGVVIAYIAPNGRAPSSNELAKADYLDPTTEAAMETMQQTSTPKQAKPHHHVEHPRFEWGNGSGQCFSRRGRVRKPKCR